MASTTAVVGDADEVGDDAESNFVRSVQAERDEEDPRLRLPIAQHIANHVVNLDAFVAARADSDIEDIESDQSDPRRHIIKTRPRPESVHKC